MKKLLLSAIYLAPLALWAQQKDFTINGKIGKLNAPAKAYLARMGVQNVVTDSVDIKNGAFTFKGKLDDIEEAQLRIKHNNQTDKGLPDFAAIYLTPGTININAQDSISKATFPNSKINQDNAKLEAISKPVKAKINMLTKQYQELTADQKKDKTVMQPFMDKYQTYMDELKPIYQKFGKENTQSYMGLVAFQKGLEDDDFDVSAVEPAFMQFDAKLRDTKIGKMIAKKLEASKSTSIGVVTDFTQNDADGKPVKLSDFKGKYVLVDFWASWCGPCRGENPNVVAAYNKYKNKNFTILGVSLDQNKDAWLKAVKDDGLVWTQVSDLKGWANEVSRKYGVSGIPFNFLVDPNGKIIAKNLREEKLHEKLAEVFDGKGK